MQSRDLAFILKRMSKLPLVIISGPKESGKTTLVKTAFKNHKYVTFDDTDTRMFATNDPLGFLNFYKNEIGIIIDEVQQVPTLFMHIQNEVDSHKRPSYFILISAEKLSSKTLQPFTSKMGMLTLLPFSLKELHERDIVWDVDSHILHGGYPRVAQEISPAEVYPAYLQSFIEREALAYIQAKNLPAFHKFMQLCAGSIGQLLNLDTLGEGCGVSFATARQWLTLLENNYLIFLLPSHTKTFNKRITKTPKLYFYDTGIATTLLRIHSQEVLAMHPLRSKLFENMMIADLYKQFYNNGIQPKLFFWRDQNGRHEIDCLVDTGTSLTAIDIKSGETISTDSFRKLVSWNKISQTETTHNFLITSGPQIHAHEQGTVLGWMAASELIERITDFS